MMKENLDFYWFTIKALAGVLSVMILFKAVLLIKQPF